MRASEGRTGNGANPVNTGEGRGEGWQEHRIGSYQEVGREFTSRIIKFYDEESVFPFVSWPPSLLHGPMVVGQPYSKSSDHYFAFNAHACIFAGLRIYLQWAPVDQQNEQQKGYARNARNLHEDDGRQLLFFLIFSSWRSAMDDLTGAFDRYIR